MVSDALSVNEIIYAQVTWGWLHYLYFLAGWLMLLSPVIVIFLLIWFFKFRKKKELKYEYKETET